jgi:hypothetical protein
MRTSSRMTAAALAVAAVAVAMPALAQQEPPAAGQAPAEANGPTTPPQKAPAAEGQQPQAAPGGAARFALVTANVNLRSRPGTDAEILATIPAGSRVEVTDCSEWCMVMWNGQSGFAIARNLDIGGTRQARAHRTAPRYAGAPPGLYEAEPPVVYGPPVYYGPPAVVYGPGYYYWGPRHYGGYGPRYYGWHRRW